jgi:GNAT superfamily N-acetyltransferase
MSNKFEKSLGQTQASSMSYAEKLDPKHTLPPIELEEESVSPIEGETFHYFGIHSMDGARIGELNVVVEDDSQQAEIDLIELETDSRGKGYGRASYVALLQKLTAMGIKLRSGNNLSREAKAIWDWMVEKGVARQLAEGDTNESSETFGYSTAEYEVI